MANQVMIDYYGCDFDILDDMEQIKKISRKTIEAIGASLVEECCHKFEPIGITYMAVISTSHFSIHTWPENGYAAVDIFSCEESVPQKIYTKLQDFFHADSYYVKAYRRNIKKNHES